jgi:hypothetical protein
MPPSDPGIVRRDKFRPSADRRVEIADQPIPTAMPASSER